MTREEFEIFTRETREDLTALAGKFFIGTCRQVGPEDIAQEALVRLWELLEKNYPINNPRALAIKIVKNSCVSLYRKSQNKALPLNDVIDLSGDSASEHVETTDNLRIKESLYRRLTPARQECMTLRNEYGLSLDEIAEVTGRPKSSVKVLISTARRQMLEQIKELL